jgi:hypothetical protein
MTLAPRSLTLASFVLCAGAPIALAQSEVEPNESKAAATIFYGASGNGLVSGESITGVTTGVSLTTPGDGSADYFRIKTAPAPLGIYRHRLQLQGTANGMTIRGLQANGTGDASLQFNSGSTVPQRFNQWYGFGKSEELYVRVTGSPTTTAPYTATYSFEPVAAIDLAGVASPGPVTITSVGRTTVDTDFWVYDANFVPVATFGNDDATVAGGGPAGSVQSIATRTLAAGTYFVGISTFNFANNQLSPSDESAADEILDFPNIALSSNSFSANDNVSFNVVSSSGTQSATVNLAGPYDVKWVRFVVGNVVALGGTAGASPAAVGIEPVAPDSPSTSSLLEVVVTPASAPASTGLGVVANLSSLGLSAATTLVDDGSNGDRIANDRIFSRRVTPAAGIEPGIKAWSATISDAQGRSANVQSTLDVRRPRVDFGVIDAGTTSLSLTAAASAIVWSKFETTCGVSADTNEFFDIVSIEASVTDPEIALYSASGELLATDDDEGASGQSLLTFGVGSGQDFDGIETELVADGRDGASLPAGVFYLAVGPFNCDFQPNFQAVSTGVQSGLVSLQFVTNAACEPSSCDSIDFNADGLFPADEDLVDFLVVLAGGTCSNDPNCNDIDFNNDGLFPSDDDLVTFLRVLAGGNCEG